MIERYALPEIAALFTDRGQKIDAGMKPEGFRNGQPFGIRESIGPATPPDKLPGSGCLGS